MKMHSLLALLLATQSAFATSFYIRPFPEFTKTTPNIIHGKLSGIHTENGITSDGGKTIYTYAKLDIKEVYKGNISGTEIIVRKLGGTKDGVTLEIPSSVEFSENEDGVFFLSGEHEDHSYEITGMELGKFGLEQKDGEQILKGGLLAYTSPPSDADHSHDVTIGNVVENHRSWSVSQLKELIKSQGQTPDAVSPGENPKPPRLQPHLKTTILYQISQILIQSIKSLHLRTKKNRRWTLTQRSGTPSPRSF